MTTKVSKKVARNGLAMAMAMAMAVAPVLWTPQAARAQNGLTDIPDTAVSAQLESFHLPEGAKIELFASDPMISKPVQMNWDSQGRLWLVGSAIYPHIEPGQEEADSIYILEDTDQDGVADKVTTFAENLHIPTGVLPGDGGVYVANSTEMLFLEDTDGDGKADRRRVVLSGFGTEDTHHLVHTFRRGPEGMMWFNQSIYIHSHIETPYGVRRLMGGGIWHFRPETQRLDVFAKGLINPWGHAFDRWGQSFATDGAGFEGINYLFPRAVYLTSPGATRVLHGLNPGQPKHCGLEIVSGRHVPEEWLGMLIAPDFRGDRVNRFKVSPSGSGYISVQQEDVVASTHRAFRPIDVRMGPEGAIYIADWYNPIIQHGEVDFRDPRRDHLHGRIWRVTFEGRDLVERPDIAGAPIPALLDYLKAPEDWTRNFSREELRGRGKEAVMPALEKWVAALDKSDEGYTHHLLEALWTAQNVNVLREDWLRELLTADDYRARAAALRALYYRAAEVKDAHGLAAKALEDEHPQVRLWAISVLAQLPDADTVSLALSVLDRGEELDEFLDFALWSIVREHEDRWIGGAETGDPFNNPAKLLFAARALNRPVAVNQVLDYLEAGDYTGQAEAQVADFLAKVGNPNQLSRLFAAAQKPEVSAEVRTAMLQAFVDAEKLRKLKPAGDLAPISGILTSASGTEFETAAHLAGLWKVEAARPALRDAFLQADKDEARARAAMEGLRALGGQPTAQLFEQTAKDTNLNYRQRSLGVIGRTMMNPQNGAQLAVAVLADSPDGKDPVGIYDAFLSTKQGPKALAAALESGKLPQEIALLGVQKAGSAATNPQGLIAAIQKAADLKPMKTQLTPEEMEAMMQRVAEHGDPHRGEGIYRQFQLQCSVCHAIGGVGGMIGPDLVSIGSSAPVDYLIESLLEPSKKIKEGYHTTLVTTKSGQAIAGAIAREDANELVIRDAAGQEQRIPKSEIASNQVSPISLMPPGLTASLREDQFVDLVRFLSELGKEGDFKTAPNRYVRHWALLQPHDRTRDAVGHLGTVIFAEDFKGYEWFNAYSRVDGSLPTSDMPEVVGRKHDRWGVARFYVEAEKAGEIALKVEGKAGLSLFLDREEIKLPEGETSATVTVELPEGVHRFTVAGVLGEQWDSVRVELLDVKGSPAQARVLPHLEWPKEDS